MSSQGTQQCRVCMESVRNYKNFTSFITETQEETVQKVFEFCVKCDLSIFRNLSHQMVLCLPCTKALKFTYDFLQQALSADQEYRRLLQEPEAKDQEIFTSIHIKSEPIEISSFQSLEDDEAVFQGSINDSVNFKEENDFWGSEHTDTDQPLTRKGGVDGGGTTDTDSTSEKIRRRRRKANLVDVPVDENALVCTKCNHKRFLTKRLFNKHIMRLHREDQHFLCNLCEHEFTKPKGLVKHLRIHSKRFQCNFCGKEFYLKSRLVVHMRGHTNETPYECQHCHKTFASNWYLNRHLKTHSKTDSDTHKCSYCEQEFRSYNSLNYHQMCDHFKCPYHCPHCDKGFLNRNQFKEHLEKNYGDQMTEEELDTMRNQNMKQRQVMKQQLGGRKSGLP